MLKNKIKITFFILVFYFLFFVFYILSYAQPQSIKIQDERDPFIALVTDDGRLLKFEKRGSEQIELEGVIYDPQGLSYIIVNKEIVGIGDWVGEYQVYKIEQDRVIFLKEDQETEIELKGDAG